MDFRILGPLEVLDGERQLDLGGMKQRALLALLLLNANRVVSSKRLIEDIWGERPPETAASMLRNYVSRLRKELDGAGSIETRAPGYVLHVEPRYVDLDVFQQLYDEGQRALIKGEPRSAARAFQQALALWRGPALSDLVGTEFAEAESMRLEELRRAALAARIDADLALGRDGDLIAEPDRRVRQHPHDETFRRQLMLALYRAGRQSDALGAYRDARRRLVTDLGIEPGPELRELEAAILRQDRVLRPGQVAPPTRGHGGPRRPSRRALVVAGGGAVAAALGIALPLMLTLGGGRSSVGVRANSVAAIDANGRVIADVPLGAQPLALAAGRSGVWIGTADGTAERIDPASRRVTRTIGLGLAPTDLALGKAIVWVASQGYLHRVLRVTLSDGEVRSISLPVSMPPVGRAGHVVASGGLALVADGDHSLFRVGTFDARRLADVANGFGIPGGDVAVGAGSVWVSDPHGSAVSRVDPRTGRVIASISLGSATEGHTAPIAFGEGSVWVALGAERMLFQIDPRSNAVVRTFPVGPAPSDTAVGGGSVWVADGAGGPLTRVNVAAGHASTVVLGLPTVAVAATSKQAWVAVSS